MADSDRARVTPATVDDVDPVTDLWIALAESQRAFGSTLLAEGNRGAVREWVARSVVTGELLVARDGDGDPIGFVGFALDHGGYERDRTRGVVSNLFVVPERRDEGIGSDLLDAAERALRETGAETVALEALAANERAREFYAAHGYEPHRVELRKSLAAGGGERGGDGDDRRGERGGDGDDGRGEGGGNGDDRRGERGDGPID
ncbi:GNAT family N-acetyltransferase [Halorubrum kocurii]|uniref:GCN5-related N-acetyltransferase n=1 Tax=Halorubrum kocurii JCM 14978 TaxID=1230456 RepID=M0P3C1_9EURY|nr:GNAT family N-acetyltransferase [Halorubrum kocurii]EMA64328.1 GCN5-related N-acetyltransferase [Halorubrum kocurii JCM 14978]